MPTADRPRPHRALTCGPAVGAAESRARARAPALLDARVLTVAFAYLFAVYAYIQPVGYRTAYPTLADRLAFAHSFGNNKGLRLLYGDPHDIADGRRLHRLARRRRAGDRRRLFGLLAAVRALRGRGGRRPDGARPGRRRRRGAP